MNISPERQAKREFYKLFMFSLFMLFLGYSTCMIVSIL